ncbi:hypothetical protein HK096_000089 [Nowakowskiella sp. JEL0078]|nr:hypothetical protein HK096_000089 [Nowakowskiella sp. JEL0078]
MTQEKTIASIRSAHLKEVSNLKIELQNLQQKRLETRIAQLPQTLIDTILQANNSLNLTLDEIHRPSLYEGVTVLVVSVAGFSKLLSQFINAPQLILQFLREYHTEIQKIASRFPKCYIAERICDACVIVSGIPERHEEHAANIADTAVAIFEWVTSWDVSHILGTKEKVGLRLGIHSGPAISGIIGEPPRYMIMGETINLASRIEALCTPFEIRISSATQSLLQAENTTREYHISLGHPVTSRPYNYGFENRGSIDLKLRGKLEMFALLTIRIQNPVSMPTYTNQNGIVFNSKGIQPFGGANLGIFPSSIGFQQSM